MSATTAPTPVAPTTETLAARMSHLESRMRAHPSVAPVESPNATVIDAEGQSLMTHDGTVWTLVRQNAPDGSNTPTLTLHRNGQGTSLPLTDSLPAAGTTAFNSGTTYSTDTPTDTLPAAGTLTDPAKTVPNQPDPAYVDPASNPTVGVARAEYHWLPDGSRLLTVLNTEGMWFDHAQNSPSGGIWRLAPDRSAQPGGRQARAGAYFGGRSGTRNADGTYTGTRNADGTYTTEAQDRSAAETKAAADAKAKAAADAKAATDAKAVADKAAADKASAV